MGTGSHPPAPMSFCLKWSASETLFGRQPLSHWNILLTWTESWKCLGVYISPGVTLTLGVWKPLSERWQPPDCLLPSRVVLQHQAQAGTSPEVALCMASSLLLSCFHYSLSGFSWSEKSLNEMPEHHLRVCSGKPGTSQISTSYNYCLNKWDFIFCMRKNEARPSPYSIFKHQLKMD